MCVSYIYGGCRGTANLHESEAECKAACPKVKPPPSPRSSWTRPGSCLLPPVTGNV